jgi:alpha-ketoglutarate-dependent taurine dioxygenase
MKFLTIPKNEQIGKNIKKWFTEYEVIHVANRIHEPEKSTDDYWLDQAHQIGELVVMDEDKSTGNKTGNFWIDIKYDPNFPNHFIHANARQPLHTDGSYEATAPNISFFYCVREADIGGATTFVDIDVVKECLQIEAPNLLEQLKTQPINFSKGNDSKITPVFYENKCNWNYFRAEKCDLADAFHQYLETRIINMGIVHAVKLQPGEALFFKDEYILHGRNAFIGNRWLKKGGIQWTTP